MKRDGIVLRSDEGFGWYLVMREYDECYRRSLMHTESNIREADYPVAWRWKR